MQRKDITNLLENIEKDLGSPQAAAKQCGVALEIWEGWKRCHGLTRMVLFLSCLERAGYELKIRKTGPGDKSPLSAAQVTNKRELEIKQNRAKCHKHTNRDSSGRFKRLSEHAEWLRRGDKTSRVSRD